MKIGVISDTHDHMNNIRKFVDIFVEKKVDCVFHCGDIVSPFMNKAFIGLKNADIPFYGVYGNNDGERAGLHKIFGEVCKIQNDTLEMEIDGRNLLMFHHLSPKIVDAICSSGKYDLVLKGHTHQIVNRKVGDTLLLNPGEGCGYLTGTASAAIVDLEKLEAEIISFKNTEI